MWSHKGFKHQLDLETGETSLFLKPHIERLALLMGENVILYGSNGSGKYRIVTSVLQDKLHFIHPSQAWEYKTYTVDNDKHSVIQLLIRQSPSHFEIMMKDSGSNERYIVKHIVRDLSKNMSISMDGKLAYKTVVIYNVDCFSSGSQQILAVFMEKHMLGTRFVFTTSKFNGVCNSLKSRSFALRIPRPNPSDLHNHLNFILRENNIQPNPKKTNETVGEIVRNNDCHIDDCITALQLWTVSGNNTLTTIIDDIINKMRCKKKGNYMKPIRDLLYTLLVNNVSGSYIIKSLTLRLLGILEPRDIPNLVEKATIFESRMRASERYIYHLEAFIFAVNVSCTSLTCK